MSYMVETYGRHVSVSVSHSPLLHIMDKVCLRGEHVDSTWRLSLPFSKK
jgi:hypothetical protein